MANDDVENKEIRETIVIQDLRSGEAMGQWQAVFELTEADYVRLCSRGPRTLTIAIALLGVWGGYALGLAPRMLGQWQGAVDPQQPPITRTEWTVLIVFLVVVAIVYVVGLLLPDDRKRVMKAIRAHFERAPRTSALRQVQ